jgi:hypothetical protein
MARLIAIAALFLLSIPANAGDNRIAGTCQFQSFVREVIVAGEQQTEFGEKPSGYISYQPDGRMFAVLDGETSNRHLYEDATEAGPVNASHDNPCDRIRFRSRAEALIGQKMSASCRTPEHLISLAAFVVRLQDSRSSGPAHNFSCCSATVAPTSCLQAN